MRRRPLIVGNWKMNGLLEMAHDMAVSLQRGMRERSAKKLVFAEVVICPPFTGLSTANQLLGQSSVKLGAQNMAIEPSGAFTGEVSGLMLRNCGVHYVILGHSERRQYYGESDASVAQKVASAFRDGLDPIVCVGESLEEREAGNTLEVIKKQVEAFFDSLPQEAAKRHHLVIAYEPVWAIGTGKVATTEQIQQVHAFIRETVAGYVGESLAEKIRILYGGSMKPSNAQEILSLQDVDGGLIGGAALRAQDFLAIVDALPN